MKKKIKKIDQFQSAEIQETDKVKGGGNETSGYYGRGFAQLTWEYLL